MVAQDIVSYFIDNWDPANTSGNTPIIGYDIDNDDTEDGDAYVIGNYNDGVFFKNITDDADEIGLGRTHQDEDSEDIYECTIVNTSKPLCKEYLDEIRRICLLILNDDEHSWLDWLKGGRWSGPKHRKVFMLNVLFSKAGIPF